MEQSTRIDLEPSARTALIAMLNQNLANTLDLKTQAKQAHWNVKSPHFYQLHELFDQIASQLDEYVDTIAERITALGGTALGTVRMVADKSAIPELPADLCKGQDLVCALADRLALYGKNIRQDIDRATQLGDAGTADLYTEIVRSADKFLWFLEAHLQ